MRWGVAPSPLTALTCGHGTNRAHTPAVGSRLPDTSLRRHARPALIDAEIGPITPQRKQNATETARQRDDGNPPPPPRGEGVRPRAQRIAVGTPPAPEHPARLDQQAP